GGPALLVLPGVLSAAAMATAWARRHQGRKLAHLLDARSTSVAELLDLQRTVAEQMGAGSFAERVKLCGQIVCEDPLIAPWSGEPCVAFDDSETELVEVYRETTSTDADGRSSREGSWQRDDQVLSQLERRCAFVLRQGGNSLPVNPEGADLELETVVDTTDRSRSSGGLGDFGARRRSLGVRRVERILRASGSLFVVAQCSDSDGVLHLQAPDQGGLFVMRRGSEQTYSRGLRRWRRIWTVSTWTLAALAVLLLLAAVL
ncbi:MAG: GIDE domain-containing protein, partial [Cyanobium sp.]